MTMSRAIRGVFVSTLLALPLLVPVLAYAQQARSVRVEEIRRNPRAFLSEVVELEGLVTRYHPIRSSTMSAYYLEDDFGHEIQLRTSDERPPRASRVTVTGSVALERTGDPYVVVETAKILQPDSDRDGVWDGEDECKETPAGVDVEENGCPVQPAGPTVVDSGEATTPDNGITVRELLLYGGIGAIGVALLILVITLSFRSRRRPQVAFASGMGEGAMSAPQTTPPGGARQRAPSPSPAGRAGRGEPAGEEFRGKTLKFARPPAGTLKLLPGRLEIIGGEDEGEEIRFMRTTDGGVPEVTFGRSEGEPYRHVELKAPTVSRRHALMRLEGDHWVVVNFSETNPVVVNGEELSGRGGSQTLRDGDELEMGEVTFRFHSR